MMLVTSNMSKMTVPRYSWKNMAISFLPATMNPISIQQKELSGGAMELAYSGIFCLDVVNHNTGHEQCQNIHNKGSYMDSEVLL